jgi:septum formation protein
VAVRLSEGYVIGADTIVVADEAILGKPVDDADARRMLKLLSGRSHYVYTGLCVIERQNRETTGMERDYVRTEVRFGPLTDELIDGYVATGEPLDKAGAYGIQERGSVLVEGIVGDYFNVVGLPVYRLSRMLMDLGVCLFS